VAKAAVAVRLLSATVQPPLPIETVAYAVAAWPALFVQVTEYVVVVEGDTVAVPDVALPVEKFVVQETAWVDDHVRVDVWPVVIAVGLAESDAVGEAADTETVALAIAVWPLRLLQATEYVVVAEGETVAVPDVALPVWKFVPVQETALVDDHVRADVWPLVIAAGLAESVAARLNALCAQMRNTADSSRGMFDLAAAIVPGANPTRLCPCMVLSVESLVAWPGLG
jgi:hypothetical protein